MRGGPLLLLAVTLAALVALSTLGTALMVDVAAGEVLELTEPIAAETILTFQFNIPDEQYLDVKLVSADGNVLKDFGKTATEGVYVIEASAKATAATVRLDNSASTFSTVKANVYLRHTINHNFAADVRQLDPIEQKVHSLSALMSRLQTLQTTLRTQQKNHRSTVEDANERVLLWSIFQVIALVAMSGFQLYFLKRFLEKKSFV